MGSPDFRRRIQICGLDLGTRVKYIGPDNPIALPLGYQKLERANGRITRKIPYYQPCVDGAPEWTYGSYGPGPTVKPPSVITNPIL